MGYIGGEGQLYFDRRRCVPQARQGHAQDRRIYIPKEQCSYTFRLLIKGLISFIEVLRS